MKAKPRQRGQQKHMLPFASGDPLINLRRRERRGKRVTSEVVVMLSGQSGAVEPEWASTENISERGARILTTHQWRPNDGLLIRCIEGNLQARGRVIYRQRLRENLHAIGVKLIASKGSWERSKKVQTCSVFAFAG
jgi:hypothetical protein